jgi:chitodextrinase
MEDVAMRRTAGFTALTCAAVLALAACGTDPKEAERPTTPARVTAQTGTATSVHVMWSRGAGGAEVSGYAIYRGSTKVKDVSAGQTMTDITGLKPSTSYTFTVRARDATGQLSPGSGAKPVRTPAEVAADTDPPAAPARLSGRSEGPRAADLTWERPQDDEGITSYDVYQGDSKIHSVGGDVSTARITLLRPGTRYRFTLMARDAAGNASAASSPVEITTPHGPGDDPDTAPRDFRATSHPADGGRYLDLSWTPPRTGADAPSYQIYLGGKFATTLIWGGEAPQGRATYSVYAGKEAGATYRVKIRAKLPDGNWGRFSTEETVTTAPGRP